MDDRLPDCVIAASSRFNDIQPYSARIYAKDPQTWGSLFPWEFPQNASREEEEAFLRRFFSDVEIHMQGGDSGPGNGFKFLKQVWYCNALWNLNHRVPAVESWFWKQSDSMVLLKDPKINEFFFKPDVQPATFFRQAELDMYGEKFLTWVIPGIQRIAKTLLEQQKSNKQANAKSLEFTPTATVSSAPVAGLAPKADVTAQDKAQSGVEQDVHTAEAKQHETTTSDYVQSSLHLNNAAQALPKIAGGSGAESELQAQSQLLPRRRGSSGSQRFNNRGGYPQSRQPLPFNELERHAQLSYPRPYGPIYGAANIHPRGMQGHPVHILRPVPQGQMIPTSMPSEHPLPAHFVQGNHPNQYIAQPYQPGTRPLPIYYNTSAFGNRGNDQAFQQTFAPEAYLPSVDDSFNPRGGYRRGSYGSRGGKTRGINGPRGRGSRARNSFTGSDRPSFSEQGMNRNRQSSIDSSTATHHPKARRGRMIREGNWRSGSDHPQKQEAGLATRENMVPTRAFSGAAYAPGGFVPDADVRNQWKTSYSPKPQSTNTKNIQDLQTSLLEPAINSNRESFPSEMQPFNPEMGCGQKWIGAECTIVTKLIAFDIPGSLPDNEIVREFSQYANVEQAHRVQTSNTPADKEPLVFVRSPNHNEARKFLSKKPPTWLGGRPLRVEVPMEYWNPAHKAYHNHWHSHVHRNTATESEKSNMTEVDTSKVPKILQRVQEGISTPRSTSIELPHLEETQSEETTPTPSGASTPKRKVNKKKKKPNSLRKTSLAPIFDRIPYNDKEHDSGNVPFLPTTLTQEVSLSESHKGTSNKASGEAIAAPANSVKTRATLEESEMPTASVPDLTASNIVETGLPQLAQGKAVDTAVSSGDAKVSTEASEWDVQLVSERSKLPQNVESLNIHKRDTTLGPAENHENGNAQILDSDGKKVTIGDSKITAPIEEAPFKAGNETGDESFHTASGSPDSAKNVERFSNETDPRDESGIEAEDSPSPGATAKISHETSTGNMASPFAEETSPVANLVRTPKDKKVHIPQLRSKPKVTISTVDADAQSQDPNCDPLPHTGTGTVPPTPAFVTAPNTPAVLQETQEDEEAEPAPTASKKMEKPKGPAQTESLSLFGKKKEKKPKAPKKGTLRGKPNQNERSTSDLASGTSSRAVSVSHGPTSNVECSLQGSGKTEDVVKGGQDMLRTDSKQSVTSSAQPKHDEEGKTTAQEDVGSHSVTQEDTPSKRRGKLGNLLSFFGGGQQAPVPLKETKSDIINSSKSWLTSSKAQDHPLNNGIKEADQAPPQSNSTSFGEDGVVPVASNGESRPVTASSGDTNAGSHNDVQQRVLSDDGLGISFDGAAEQHDDGRAKAKKKKPRKKKKKLDEVTDEASEQSTPPIQSKAPTEMFRFGEGDTSGNNQADDGSDTSSHTIEGPLTPGTDIQSPIVASPTTTLLPKSSGHLVESKKPAWKYKKRVSRIHDHAIDSNLDDEVTYVIRQSGNSDDDEQTSQSDDTTPSVRDSVRQPKTIYFFLDQGLKEETEVSQVEKSKEKIRQLGEEELRRKLAAGES